MTELYPPIEPYDHRALDVGDGNLVYSETCGNPAGSGRDGAWRSGPGVRPENAADVQPGTLPGCAVRPARLRAQRAAWGVTRPRACSTTPPTTWSPTWSGSAGHLGIGRWLVTGGSWGTTLALIYAERYPHRVSEIMVSAITTTRQSEIDWLYRGVGRFFPEEWERFRYGAVRAGSDGDLVAAYAQLMENPDPQVRNQTATSWRRGKMWPCPWSRTRHRLPTVILPAMTCSRSSGSARTTSPMPDSSRTAP